MDMDDPDGAGDFETRTSHPAWFSCDEPAAIEVDTVGDSGSDEIIHFDSRLGVWCLNDEQPKGRACKDHKVRYCCPSDYHNPCKSTGLVCGDNSQVMFQQNSTHSGCLCDCDDGFFMENDICVVDDRCTATLTSCTDFELCINPHNELTTTPAQCTGTSCSVCSVCNDPNTNGDGRKVQCNEGIAHSTDGYVACVCDGKSNCEWKSDDFVFNNDGTIDSKDFCVTDSECPVTIWRDFQDHTSFAQNRFLSDDKYNTLQSDLYDSSKGESLGKIQVDMNLQQYDYQTGHFLVLFFENEVTGFFFYFKVIWCIFIKLTKTR